MSEQIPNMNYDADEVINDFKEKFKWPNSKEVEAVQKPPKMGLNLLLSAIITIIGGGAVYYMMLPAFNFKDTNMYVFFMVLIVIFMGALLILTKQINMPKGVNISRKNQLCRL